MRTSLNRREFVQGTLAAGVVATIGGDAFRPNSANTANGKPSSADTMYDPGLHMFADDMEIERTWNVARVLGSPRPLSEPSIVADRPWEIGKMIFNYFGSVIFDPELEKFRMWYSTTQVEPNIPELECYAESVDGIHWTKPSLGVIEFKGSSDNNIVYSTQGSDTGWYRFAAFRDESSPRPEERYKGFGCAHNPAGYLLVTSPDGYHWSKPKLVRTTGRDTIGMTWDPIRKVWLNTARGASERAIEIQGDPIARGERLIGIYESPDMVNWSYQGLGLRMD